MNNKSLTKKMKNQYPFERKGIWLAGYLLCGAVAAISLLTAMQGNAIVHLSLATAGLLGMVVINVILGMQKEGKSYLKEAGLRRDIGILIMWAMLLFVCYVEQTGI